MKFIKTLSIVAATTALLFGGATQAQDKGSIGVSMPTSLATSEGRLPSHSNFAHCAPTSELMTRGLVGCATRKNESAPSWRNRATQFISVRCGRHNGAPSRSMART